ncbi:MAG TPA: TonB-dependent receptor [Acidobacteriaceae bacterium]|nr:TonB-dependent receptor [Acidobacteriaceae bacterium]
MISVARLRVVLATVALCLVGNASLAHGTVFSDLRGIVHDPQHRPIAGVHITASAVNSAFSQSGETNAEGAFTLLNVPLGDYNVTVVGSGFATLQQAVTVHSGVSPVLHFELNLLSVSQSVTVTAPAATLSTMTPTTLVSRAMIEQTPGADRTNSLSMITDNVPGAYMTHDMLHIRGGHQVSWLIDGIEIPNTNIASNVGAQISPRDIDYLEVQRGSYSADLGDRTYGIFNVVPRTGFERSRQGEFVASAGSFFQTDDQLSFGDHTQRVAWYASVNGNRSNYGLAPPISHPYHDAANGFGGFGSLIDNRTARDQLRFVVQARNDFFQIPYDPSTTDFEAQQFNKPYGSSHLRDAQHETDALAVFSWIRTLSPSAVVQVSPFYHFNRADYSPGPNDLPVATTSNRSSNYGGVQASFTLDSSLAHGVRNTLQAGIYSFGQHDGDYFAAVFNGASGSNFALPASASAGVVEEFVSDNIQPTSWLTLSGGLRYSRFQGPLVESEITPRIGASIRIPRLNWVFRGFYGRFYQPPPLLTASGPLVQYAQANDTDFAKLHGERDEEHQFGVEIPVRGWLLDADTFKTRANNFLDHSNLGESSLYYPVTIDGALVRAWELTLRSPRIAHIAQLHLAYSNQIAEQRGAITGGLICAPVSSPQCDVGFDYSPLDHDQRNTLSAGVNATLPHAVTASANVSYGSGFVNGAPDPTLPYPNAYLPAHTAVDLALGKAFTESLSGSITATNIANRRVLLDNSLTFGGFHFNDPRQIYAELRYRFKF